MLPMPRTGLARLPQIIRPHAPAIQLPASAAAAATQGPRAPSPSSAQPLGYPPVSAAPTTAPFSGFPQAFSATPVVLISDTQVASGALQSSKTPYGIRLPSLTPAPMQRLSLHAGSTEPIGLPRGAALSTSPPVQGTVPGTSCIPHALHACQLLLLKCTLKDFIYQSYLSHVCKDQCYESNIH